MERSNLKIKNKNKKNKKQKTLHGTQVHGARVPFKAPLQGSLNIATGSNLKKKKKKRQNLSSWSSSFI